MSRGAARTGLAHVAAATLIGAVDGLLLQHAVDPAAFPDPIALRTTLLRVVDKVVRP